MDIFNIGPAVPKVGPSNQPQPSPDGSRASKTRGGSAAASDSYAISQGRRDVARFVDRLRSGEIPEVREELVQKFRALMQSGGLETEESLRATAESLLREEI